MALEAALIAANAGFDLVQRLGEGAVGVAAEAVALQGLSRSQQQLAVDAEAMAVSGHGDLGVTAALVGEGLGASVALNDIDGDKLPNDLCVTDPRTDAQAIKEASYVNIPVIALCDTDSPTEFVDIAIPTNNKARHSIGLVWWMLSREVLRLRGTLPSREAEWDVMVDLYFYRDPEAEEQKALEGEEKAVEAEVAPDAGFAAAAPGGGDWEVAGGAGFAAPEATAPTGSWDAEPVTGGDWAAEAAPTTAADPAVSGW